MEEEEEARQLPSLKPLAENLLRFSGWDAAATALARRQAAGQSLHADTLGRWEISLLLYSNITAAEACAAQPLHSSLLLS